MKADLRSVVQRADEWRTPMPSTIEVAGWGPTGQMSAEGAGYAQAITVKAPHRPPEGYGSPDAPVSLPVPDGYVMQPPPDSSQAATVEKESVPPDQFFQNEPPVFADTVTPTKPLAAVSLDLPATGPQIEVEFAIRIGGEEESFNSSYHKVLREENLLVFVKRVGETLWLPKPRKSAEIAAKVAGISTVFQLVVLPLRFNDNGYQYGLAMISRVGPEIPE
jgi:hypothetical protein